MSPIYVPGKVVLRQTWQPMDPDAAAYITAVETADTEPLEERTKIAIDNFVLGCKADGIWSAIKASCILAGARTLTGALIPLAGTAPTNNNFVSGDYNRKTGLVGNGSTKWLNSNRANNADPQNNAHLALYVSTISSNGHWYIGCNQASGGISGSSPDAAGLILQTRGTDSGIPRVGSNLAAGFMGATRSTGTNMTRRFDSSTQTASYNSTLTNDITYAVFGRNTSGSVANYSNARLAFYSIGESLDLALLDARVTDLINAFGAAIP
jgi:hypothetical protein